MKAGDTIDRDEISLDRRCATRNDRNDAGDSLGEVGRRLADVNDAWRRWMMLGEDHPTEIAIEGDEDASFGNGSLENRLVRCLTHRLARGYDVMSVLPQTPNQRCRNILIREQPH